MSLLVESIKVVNGRLCKMSQHQNRIDNSILKLYGITNHQCQLNKVEVPHFALKGTWKCRIVYNNTFQEVYFSPYSIRKIATIKILIDNEISYDLKYLDRKGLDNLYNMRGAADEIIIIKEDYVTDAYYYNLVFEKEGLYYTPINPLLEGLRRNDLIAKDLITPIKIKFEDIYTYEKVHLINALTPLKKIVVPCTNIYQ